MYNLYYQNKLENGNKLCIIIYKIINYIYSDINVPLWKRTIRLTDRDKVNRSAC